MTRLWQLKGHRPLPAPRRASGQGILVAVGGHYPWMTEAPATVVTSADGRNWVEQDAQITNTLASVIYAAGMFIAVGGGISPYGGKSPGLIASSTDGVNWIERFSNSGISLAEVTYGTGLFVAVGGVLDSSSGSSSNLILTSTDGITWTAQNSKVTEALTTVAYHDGTFVALGGTQHTNISYSGFSGEIRWRDMHRTLLEPRIPRGKHHLILCS